LSKRATILSLVIGDNHLYTNGAIRIRATTGVAKIRGRRCS
jgi:hypothetical protein